MGWKDILKEVITQGRVKEIEDIDIDIEDDECNRKLQQMANKLKNYNLLLEERWKAGWPRYAEYFESTESKSPSSKIFQLFKKGVDYSQYFEQTRFTYNPIPEPVACKALEILESHQRTQSDGGGDENSKTYNFEHDGVDWRIIRSFNFDYQDNNNSLLIVADVGEYKNRLFILLEWGNGEFFTGIYDENDNRIDTSGINKYSGYYDAREFGFSWHK